MLRTHLEGQRADGALVDVVPAGVARALQLVVVGRRRRRQRLLLHHYYVCKRGTDNNIKSMNTVDRNQFYFGIEPFET